MYRDELTLLDIVVGLLRVVIIALSLVPMLVILGVVGLISIVWLAAPQHPLFPLLIILFLASFIFFANPYFIQKILGISLSAPLKFVLAWAVYFIFAFVFSCITSTYGESLEYLG